MRVPLKRSTVAEPQLTFKPKLDPNSQRMAERRLKEQQAREGEEGKEGSGGAGVHERLYGLKDKKGLGYEDVELTFTPLVNAVSEEIDLRKRGEEEPERWFSLYQQGVIKQRNKHAE